MFLTKGQRVTVVDVRGRELSYVVREDVPFHWRKQTVPLEVGRPVERAALAVASALETIERLTGPTP